MSTFRSAASAVRQSVSRSCIASTSKSVLSSARPYATAQQALPTKDAQQASTEKTASYEFGTATTKALEGAEVRRYTGKGFPRLNSTKNRVSIHHAHLWNQGPFHPLTIPLRKKGGRDNTGRIAVRNIGGGHKRRLRTVDFWRFYPGIHDVIRIEYDPGRSGHIALIRRRQGTDGLTAEELAEIEAVKAEEDKFRVPREAQLTVKSGWSYILAPDGLRAGDTVQSFRRGIPDGFVEGWKNDPAPGEEISPRALGLLRTKTLTPGNVLPLYLVPPGQAIHNIAFTAGGKMQAARSAGCSASVVAHHDAGGEALGGLNVLNMGSQYDAEGRMGKQMGHVLVKMSSGEVRKLSPGAVATIGTVSNKEYQLINLGKAGRARNLGRRPSVRGTAKNAVDHPHGGGKGKGKGGKPSHSYTGKLTRGVKTRRPYPRHQHGNRQVVSERPRGPHSGYQRKG